MNFADYWKEISVVLAGAFLVLSTAIEIRDKRTGIITIWGRVFFALTIVSIVGGFYAQWAENDAQRVKDEASRADTKAVLQNLSQILAKTNRTIDGVARVIEPLGNPDISISFVPNCNSNHFADFCARMLLAAERKARVRPFKENTYIELENVSPKEMSFKVRHSELLVNIYGDASHPEQTIMRDARFLPFPAGGPADAAMWLPLASLSPREETRKPLLTVMVDRKSKALTMYVSVELADLHRINGQVSSTLDLPHCLVSIWAIGPGNDDLDILRDVQLESFEIGAHQGRTMEITKFKKMIAKNYLYYYGVPEAKE